MSKICSRCGATMGKGAPHSEEIKIQWECWCGKIETELYSAEELERNRQREAENNGD